MLNVDITDPRTLPGFRSSLMPFVEGLLEPGTTPINRFELACLQFASAFYEVNKLQVDVQSGKSSPFIEDMKLRHLQSILELNNFYHSFGIHCSPIILRGNVKALQIMRPPHSTKQTDPLKPTFRKGDFTLDSE